ncbi:unnamed protein product, partial [Musa banksii]
VDDDQPLPKLDHLQNDASAMELHCIISYTLFLAFMSVLLLENLVGAASYTVGDAEGWTYGLDYQRWAQKYNFTVGDALLFSYIRGQHDVYRVVEDTFRSCDVSSGVMSSYDSGNDVVNLTRAAKYWFLCNVKGHCRGGMRFGITVARASPSPSGGGDGESPFPTSPPPPLPGNTGASVARTTWWLVVIGLCMEQVWQDISLSSSLQEEDVPSTPSPSLYGASTAAASCSFGGNLKETSNRILPAPLSLSFGCLDSSIDGVGSGRVVDCCPKKHALEQRWNGSFSSGTDVDRRKKRMIKNRESAARSRARKQAYTNELEQAVDHLLYENRFLKRQCEELKRATVHQLPVATKSSTLQRTLTAPF